MCAQSGYVQVGWVELAGSGGNVVPVPADGAVANDKTLYLKVERRLGRFAL